MDMNWWIACKRVAQEQPQSQQLRSHEHLLRLGLIAQLEHKNWFKFQNETQYLKALWNTHSLDVGPYRFDQRLALLFASGLSQPSKAARSLLLPIVGQVPYLGSGLFRSDGIPLESSEALHSWFFCNGGFEMAQRENGAESITSNSESLHDGECGNGSKLASAFREALNGSISRDVARNERPSDVLVNHVFGSDSDSFCVLETRTRLALMGFEFQDGLDPVPLPDLNQLVRVNTTPTRQFIENSQLEFKSSFEWNTRTGTKSRDLKWGVLRSVAGFLNSTGGTLLIGVNDQGQPVGLDHELKSLNTDKAEDVFEGKLREAFKNSLDPFPLGLIDIVYESIDNFRICKISVQPTKQTTYLSVKDANGIHSEELCIRDGNRTLNLSGRLRDQFILDRKSN